MTSVCVENDKIILDKITEKLLLDSRDKLSKKGYEYLRLLKVKRGAGLVGLSETCAIVICLNLAANKLGCSFDKGLAVRVSGVTKKNYASLYHTVEKVLGLDKPLTVGELCIKLALGSEVADLARKLIDRYVSSKQGNATRGSPLELDHPMYACAAVLAACRHRKVRVKREPVVEQCRIKAKELDKLAADLAKFADQMDRPIRKRSHHLIDLVEQMVKESENTSIKEDTEEEEKDSEPKESFAEWKKRMLEKAAET